MTTLAATDRRYSLSLDDPAARSPALSGSKAANLAIARGGGIAVIPGFAVTTTAHAEFLRTGHRLPESVCEQLRPAWSGLTRDGEASLVVRSSSTVEDVGASSMAGRFRSMLDVLGWEAFLDALATVLGSADDVGGTAGPSPMGVLVQPYVVPRRGGVMFGVDPVSGDPEHVVIEAVAGGPDALVSGRVTAQHYTVSRRGRAFEVDHRPQQPLSLHRNGERLLTNRELRALAALAGRAHQTFGSPQDVEWAIDDAGTLLLLQSRPVTATGVTASAVGPVMGPGPVAETFPDALGPLEKDLWVVPLCEGVQGALRETRAVSRRRLEESPVVTTVRNRVAADLELFGYVPRRHLLARLDPRPPSRRLSVAWHVGQLRAVLPQRAADLVRDVDVLLSACRLRERSDSELLDWLDRCAKMLRRLHHEEVLAGTLLPPATKTAAAVALDVLAEHGGDGADADGLLRRYPVLLSLTPPALGLAVNLPPAPARRRGAGPPPTVAELGPREQIRLRARWVQELSSRIAWQLGVRLAARGLLDQAADVALLDRAALTEAVTGGSRPGDLRERLGQAVGDAFSDPLPAQFRLTPDGDVVPAARLGARPGCGVGAGGGQHTGTVVHVSARSTPEPGDVLVVRDLEPELAGWLPELGGLVAETGGTLSHLAILAREYGVPTVVGVHDALCRFEPGMTVLVDGATGEVRRIDEEETP